MSEPASVIELPSQPAADWKPRFFTIWSGQLVSLLGSQLVQFALIWYLTEQTGSAVTLSIATLAAVLPQALLSPFIGTLVDRINRRAIMLAADSAVALATLLLAVLFALELVQVWHIYLLLFVRGVGSRFHASAWGASIVLIVPKEHLARVQGLNQSLQGGLDIVAAPLGALLLAWLPMHAILGIDVATALVAISALLLFTIPQPRRSNPKATSFARDFVEGLHYVLAWRGLMIILGMVMVINALFFPALSLLPLVVSQHFGGGAEQLAIMNAAAAIGTIGGGLVLGTWGGFRRRVVTAQLGLAALGLSNLIVGLMPANGFWIACGAVAAGSLLSVLVSGSFGAVLQVIIAPELQGRVFGLIMTLATAIAPLSLSIAGPVAERLGLQFWFIFGGAICMIVGLMGLTIPAVMGIESREPS